MALETAGLCPLSPYKPLTRTLSLLLNWSPLW